MKFLLLVILALPPNARAELAPPATLSSQQIFASAKEAVFRLSTLLTGASARAQHGTAFAVHESGLLVTNYHVVKDFLLAEGRFRLQLELASGGVPARVIAVDAVNDLALIKIDTSLPKALPIAEELNAQEGEVIYSLGFPANDQLTFAQGNFGGEKLVGFVTSGFATLPLNSGMSGGPMLSGRAQVIGVNRAMVSQAQNLSFFSPLASLKKLVETNGAGRNPASFAAIWRDKVVESIRAQEQLSSVHPAGAFRVERLGKVSFSVPLANQSCGQSTLGKKDDSEVFVCQSRSLTPLVGKANALEVFTMGFLSEGLLANFTDPLGRQLQTLYKKEKSEIGRGAKGGRAPASESHAPEEVCGMRNVRNGAGVEMTVSFCSLANSYFEGISSTFVRIRFGKDKMPTLVQFYQGLTAGATADLLHKFLESVRIGENREDKN